MTFGSITEESQKFFQVLAMFDPDTVAHKNDIAGEFLTPYHPGVVFGDILGRRRSGLVIDHSEHEARADPWCVIRFQIHAHIAVIAGGSREYPAGVLVVDLNGSLTCQAFI